MKRSASDVHLSDSATPRYSWMLSVSAQPVVRMVDLVTNGFKTLCQQ